ncbi:MAG: 50S ribosomal protein L16, partial [Alphaproteobacteria bacterium]|nr:50S ribosomal protein L16 [Alphaproteobacteria bacterium]
VLSGAKRVLDYEVWDVFSDTPLLGNQLAVFFGAEGFDVNTMLAITREMKRAGRVWIRVFPDVPVTSKPTEVRMGKGKGAVDYWACRVKPGRVMFEIDGVPKNIAEEAFVLAAAKLPIKTRIVTRLGDEA